MWGREKTGENSLTLGQQLKKKKMMMMMMMMMMADGQGGAK
jgi:hypothetical protein